MRHHAIRLSASILALASSTAAMAQAAPAASSEAAADETTPDIIVTATRRSENLMRSPISAAVLSGENLAEKGVANVDALQFAMPSVVVNNFGQGNDFNIRGIGKAEHNTQTTTGVITYRDGVPSFPGYFQAEPYFDVANIQVLRGPQGTVVGQNATGGAVFVNTNDPVIGGGVHGYIQAQLGNYMDVGVQGAINIPISDTFAARIAFFGERRDGFYNVTGPMGLAYEDANNDLAMAAARISFLWKPNDHLSILSKTDVDYLDMGAYPASPVLNNFPTLPGTTTPNPNYRDLFDISANMPQEARDKFIRSILKIDYVFDSGLKLRSVSGFQNGNTFYRADLDGTAATAVVAGVTRNATFFDSVTETQFSQEFNIISPDNQRFTWLLGGFGLWNTYFFESPYQFVIDNPTTTGQPLGTVAGQYKLQGRNPQQSYAVFGQVGFAITPSLKIELSGRYTNSRTTNHVDVIQFGTPIVAEQMAESNNFSYKASLGWAASPNHYFYGFAATGFRPGGLNVPVGFGTPAPFEPEEVTSYELGWKANFAGGRIRTTVNGFYNDYKNFQVIIGNPTLPVFGLEVNVPNNTKIYGIEAEAEFRLGALSLDVGVSALHSEIGAFFATDPRALSLAPCAPATGPVSATCLNLGGREQTYAPNFTFNVGAQYQIDLGDGHTLTPRANFGHIAAQWATLFQRTDRGDRLGERNILNAQLEWKRGTLAVTAYATNLTNQHYVGALNSGLNFAGPPRQYGVKVMKAF